MFGRPRNGYLALTLDTVLNYNNRAGRWDNTTRRVRSIFDRHDFAFVWSYAEMAPLVTGVGYDWGHREDHQVHQGARRSGAAGGERCRWWIVQRQRRAHMPPSIAVTCKPGDSLDHIDDGRIDAVVMDPPYYGNVMYAELSDFFYVWLKRTAGHVFPELFRRNLTDKDNEAVANVARFQGEKGAKALAGRDYQARMASIFAECRRVLKPDGIMTLMFTHKETAAWDSLAKGLMEAGFAITASWPINNGSRGESPYPEQGSSQQHDLSGMSPARSQGRFRRKASTGKMWSPKWRRRFVVHVGEFQKAGIAGVDLYLASFGPALEEFSRHWPLRRGTPREAPQERRLRRQQQLLDDEWDPYVATPEDALDVARREVKRWRLEQLTHLKADADLDPVTAFFVLAWDAFRAPVFSYDEALRLARAVGTDLDRDIVGRLAAKKSSDISLWDSGVQGGQRSAGPCRRLARNDRCHPPRCKSGAHAFAGRRTGIARRRPGGP